jgi:two-component system sensor histidine kinase PilS (NtrC family)
MNSKLPIQDFIQIDTFSDADNRSRDGSVNLTLRRLFVIYNTCRILLAIALLSLLIIPNSAELISQFDRTMFVAGSSLLLLSALILLGSTGRWLYSSQTHIFGLILFDVTLIAMIVGAAGGILSGFSVLYLITVFAAATMIRDRALATVIAAIAVLAVLMDTAWMVGRNEATINMLLSAGILGSLLFALSLLVQVMTSRLAEAEADAVNAKATVEALQRLNEQIIIHMETGILLADHTGSAICINDAAQTLLGLAEGERVHLLNISADLANQYQEWCETSTDLPEPFRIAEEGPTMVASFVALSKAANQSNLIFIEDYTPVTQFAQSLKLNSLSKLTASIAHEIRNPLGAISHAAQLLTESNTVDAADGILCDILVSNSRRVSDIIDNVSEVSRRQAPKPTDILLSSWLPAYVEEYRSLQQQPYDIAISDLEATDLAISVDSEHLKRILSNLFDNALRYSIEDGDCSRIRLDTSIEKLNGHVHLDIVDFGLGVTEYNLARLFEPFFTTSKHGSGLGLYLCKELCEINGARLTYRRTKTGESAFRITFDRVSTPL